MLGVAIFSKGVGALGVEIKLATSPETSSEPNATQWIHKLKWKQEKNNKAMCGELLKTVFWKFEKSWWEHYISKNFFNFWNKFL